MDILVVIVCLLGGAIAFRWAAKSSTRRYEYVTDMHLNHRIELFKVQRLLLKADIEADPDIRHQTLTKANEHIVSAIDSSYDLERKA